MGFGHLLGRQILQESKILRVLDAKVPVHCIGQPLGYDPIKFSVNTRHKISQFEFTR
jgi:hypothetical protein